MYSACKVTTFFPYRCFTKCAMFFTFYTKTFFH